MFSVSTFNIVLIVMTVMAVVVFVSLFFVDAGYGRFYAPKWGAAIDNRLGWMLMEAPVFVAMLLLWWLSDRREDGIRLVFLLLFELHYFHRAFVFPWLMRGRSKMPLSIIGTAVLFNTLNAYMQGGWLFYVSPVDYYSADWLTSLPFLAGTALFLFGMGVNIHSDRIIRNLRKPGAGSPVPITLASWWNGRALPSSPGRCPGPCLPCGPLPTWRRGRRAFTTDIGRNFRSSWIPVPPNASFPLFSKCLLFTLLFLRR